MAIKKRILILGGGVSGLSLAWYLGRASQDYLLLEKEKEVGGCMGSQEEEGFFIEKGPRVFKTSRNEDFLEWINQMGYDSHVIPSSPQAERRFLWVEGGFQNIPRHPFSFLFSSFCRPLLISLWKERKKPPYLGDETVWDFACRRFGKKVAERFFDPLVLGIYAGDCKKLSVCACFPQLKEWEQTHGSITRGFLSSEKRKRAIDAPTLFSFRKGTGDFLKAVSSKLSVVLEEEVISLEREGGLWLVRSSRGRVFEADIIVSALPAFTSAFLLQSIAAQSSQILHSFPYQDITTLHMGWTEKVLPFPGFGYLVPSSENESILGVLFDTEIVPQGDRTLLCAMVSGVHQSEQELFSEVRERIRKEQLKIEKDNSFFSWKKKERAIPQYYLGHQEKKEKLLNVLAREAPGLYLLGNYLDGVSVNDCVRRGKELAKEINNKDKDFLLL